MTTRLNTQDRRIANQILRARNPQNAIGIKQLCCLKSNNVMFQFDPKSGRYIGYPVYPNGQEPEYPIRNQPICEVPGRSRITTPQRFRESQIRRRLERRVRRR